MTSSKLAFGVEEDETCSQYRSLQAVISAVAACSLSSDTEGIGSKEFSMLRGIEDGVSDTGLLAAVI